MTTISQAITALPTPPSTASPSNFATLADAFLAALLTFATQLETLRGQANTVAGEVNTNAGTATNAASAAAISASLASLSANITAWSAPTSYPTGATVYSPTNYQAYRRKTPGGVNGTDPAADASRTYWEPVTVGGLYLVIVSGTTATAVAGQLLALTNVGASTATGPSAALAGDRWGVVVCNGLLTNAINWNGLKHMNLSDATTTLDDAYAWIEPTYISAGYGWGF